MAVDKLSHSDHSTLNTPQTAMVMAAGLGTRMMPLTKNTPKPLIQVLNKPLIDYALEELCEAHINKAIVNVHYCANQIEHHVTTITKPEIIISDERSVLLETGGGLRKARPLLGEGPIYCANTDAILAGGPVGAGCLQLSKHWGSDMLALLLLCPIERTLGFEGLGDFHFIQNETEKTDSSINDPVTGKVTGTSQSGKIIKAQGEKAPFAFTGFQILHPSLLDDTPEGPFSTRLLWQKAARKNALYGTIYPHQWLHVGTPEGVLLAEEQLRSIQHPQQTRLSI